MDTMDNLVGHVKDRADSMAHKADSFRHKADDFLSASKSVTWGPESVKHPERVRALLNLILTPRFQPTFEPQKDEPADEVSYQLLGSGAVEETPSIPRRMFDLGTGNMVDWLDNDDVGQYCILSHSWKGAEVDLDYVERAKQRNREKVKAGDKGAENHVKMVMSLCWEEVQEKKEAILSLLKEVDGPQSQYDVGKILQECIEVNSTKKELKEANKEMVDAKAKLSYANLKSDAFKALATEMENSVPTQAASKADDEKQKDPGGKEVKKANDNLTAATAKLKEKNEKSEAVKEKVEFFGKNSQLREAVEELNSLVSRWRSAVKIDQSIRRAQEIFRDKLFSAPKDSKRYLWLDTCCINKKDQGELVDSLSLMGDWYANAEFCLVHLDTNRSDDEWNEEWKRFPQTLADDGEPALPEPNISNYEEILKKEPQWSTRGWTLQELVLSKTTFYVNSGWRLLERPEENLGPYYFLCPFIKLYNDQGVAPHDLSKLREDWKSIVVTRGLTVPDPENIRSDEQIKAAQRLIVILEALGLRIPKNINVDNAIPLISQAVYLAAMGAKKEALAPEEEATALLYNSLGHHLNSYLYPQQDANSCKPEDIIRFLLRCLVAETEDRILKDRKYIADFAKVEPLKTWQDGTARTRFSTQRVMSLASNRVTTVETDRAYSLMGLLGVRFPTFKAEGLSQALARLFDQALISSNDVSVFNWSGREMGSRIRGRSLYPASLDAFRVDEENEEVLLANKRLMEAMQSKRFKVMKTFGRVSKMLVDMIGFLQKHDHQHLPMRWIERVVDIAQEATFEQLDEAQVVNLDMISTWIREKCDKVLSKNGKDEAGSHGHRFLDFPKFDRKHRDSMKDFAKKPVKSLFGVHSSRKRANSSADESGPPPKLVKTEDGSPAPAHVDPHDLASLKAAIQSLDAKIMDYLDKAHTSHSSPDPGNAAPVPSLPAEVCKQLAPSNDDTGTGHGKEQDSTAQEAHSMISPNPIIVNNSGIEGIFDVQRVIISFHEEKKLRHQVAKAVSPHQRITGWCSISTGFARVMVSFACEKRILEKQLKIAQAVKAKVIDDPPCARSDASHKQQPLKAGDDAKDAHQAAAEARVSRMIAFVQEQALEGAVAGEWVLARFADVPGAQWFVCALELGSTHTLHGHRISADRVDFADAIPEPGLVDVWQLYMDRKKRKLCYVLRDLLSSRQMCADKDSILHGGDGKKPDHDNPLAQLVDHGLAAVQNAGKLTTLSVSEAFYNLRGEDLHKHLTAVVLKHTPKELQSAVENLNANLDFQPATFTSGRRVHMF